MAFQWAQILANNPSNPPARRRRFHMVWAPSLGVVEMAGGQFLASGTRNSFGWDGTAWNDDGDGPSSQGSSSEGQALAWDDAHSEVVFFGGSDGFGVLNQRTFTWDGAAWTEESPATKPSARRGATFAYCPAINAPVLFGGSAAGSTRPTDTFKWTGTNWVNLSPASHPPGRDYSSSCTYGTGVLLFGGSAGAGSILDDTWFFDGSDWAELTPATTVPPARYQHAVALHETSGDAFMYGGFDSGGVLGDQWWWDGTDWVEELASPNPGARFGHALAWDDINGSLMLFAGDVGGVSGEQNDVWEVAEFAPGDTIINIRAMSAP